MATEEALIAFARRRRKQRRDKDYYRKHKDAINERRRARYARDKQLADELEEELRGQLDSDQDTEGEPADRG